MHDLRNSHYLCIENQVLARHATYVQTHDVAEDSWATSGVCSHTASAIELVCETHAGVTACRGDLHA